MSVGAVLGALLAGVFVGVGGTLWVGREVLPKVLGFVAEETARHLGPEHVARSSTPVAEFLAWCVNENPGGSDPETGKDGHEGRGSR